MSIKINQLTKVYGSQKAVDNISFSINKGEIVGFLGPNGAGKSTTMKIITGFLPATTGSAQVCDITVSENNKYSKQKIGYLPEANPLYFDMYVREYLSFISNVHQIKNKTERIEEVIKTVGLSIEANKKITQLSKGYKQRVGLSAALIHNPEVLILDEPTTGLDPNQIIEIREVIKALGKDRTVLFSSHILQEVEAICDRVIIINKGKIVADDSLKNLQQNNTQQQFVTVTFKEDIDKITFQKLSTAGNILVNANTYRIQTIDAEGLRKQLLQLSIDNNLNIVSLQTESNTLEDIFRNLTNKN
jgi:ABC-2 type transport system ATP-binding protein